MNSQPFAEALPSGLPKPIEAALARLACLDQLQRLHTQAVTSSGPAYFERVLELLDVAVDLRSAGGAPIPARGPVVVVANHPFGLIEGIVLAAVLTRVRPDVRVLANYLAAQIGGVGECFIPIDPFGGRAAVRTNIRGMREALEWLRGGGLVAVFPAGEVAHLDLKRGSIADPSWSDATARLARLSEATVVPFCFEGANSAWFQVLGMVHPRLRTALLPREFLKKRAHDVRVHVGPGITPRQLSAFGSDAAAISWLRSRTYMLAEGSEKDPPRASAAVRLIDPVAPQTMAAEIAALPPASVLASAGAITALLARAHEIPQTLREVGRLREVTFRAIGEGANRALDLDWFDQHYLHLFLWNKEAKEIAGAYRLGPSAEILPRLGARGFYSHTLFAWKRPFLERIAPAAELGRSFVRQEYQKSASALFLLWKGIGQYLVRNPEYRVLFGPVSISNVYHPRSRELIVRFLEMWRHAPELQPLVRARSPFRVKATREFDDVLGSAAEWDIERLSTLVADMEAGERAVPVLIRQYLRLGGRFVSFNVDARFSNTLDGLIVVDLLRTHRRMLERYLGREGAAAYLAAAAPGAERVGAPTKAAVTPVPT